MNDEIYQASHWLIQHQDLLWQYGVNVIAAIVTLAAGVIAARVLSRIAARMMVARNVDVTISHFLCALVRYGVLAFTCVAVLGRVGVQTASVVAVLGAAGLAVGLALQGSLSNFAAGVLLVLFRPIKVGEYVSIGSVAGFISHVQIFSTTLLSRDNKTIFIPNGKVIAENIVNYSREPLRLIDIKVGVSYDSDVTLVKRVLADVIHADARVLKDKDVTVRLMEMGASSLQFVTRAWIPTPMYWDVYFDLMENFKRALDANGISIPYPQMDIHVPGLSGAIRFARESRGDTPPQ